MTTSTEHMADITDISESPGIQNLHLTISFPENMTDVSKMSIRVINVLQSTLELERLVELFDEELAAIVPHDHFSHVNENENIKYDIGNVALHSSNYTLLLFGESIGQVVISRNTEFVEDEIQKIESLISALIYPLRNALLYKQAVEKAHIDPLTGVNNRAAFDMSIEEDMEFSARHKHDLTLMMLDLDKFKDINDNYGHTVGDAILRSFADSIMKCLRRSDILFRYGGEEFSVLLRNTSTEGAALLAERMRKSVEDMEFIYNKIKAKTTVSIGLAQMQEGDSIVGFIERADKLLFKAKDKGRNRIEF